MDLYSKPIQNRKKTSKINRKNHLFMIMSMKSLKNKDQYIGGRAIEHNPYILIIII